MAAALAGRLDLWLTVVHSPSPEVFTTGESRRDVMRRGADLVAWLSADHDVDEVIVQPGDPAQLLRACLSDGASLAVVGSRGRGPTRAALLGSVSSELARTAPCPVVIVPPGAPVSGLGEQPAFVCGIDGSDAASHALDCASRLAWSMGGRLLATHVRKSTAGRRVEEGATARALMEHELAQLQLPVEASVHIEVGDAAKQLDELAAAHRAALVVVGSRGETPLRAALVGSVSARLAACARTPVLIVSKEARLARRSSPPSIHAAA